MLIAVDIDLVGQPLAASPPVVAPLILSRLRLETRSEHDAVEQVLDLMDDSLTPQGYCQRLQQLYGFYAPLEQALHTVELTLPLNIRATLAARLNKTALLQQDLLHFGVRAEVLPLSINLPRLTTPAEVLGCVYVMEGATLGGRIITQHIQATLGFTPTTGGRFFEGYGRLTGMMWQDMRQLLVVSATDTATQDAIVANAINTFACLRTWCQPFHLQTAHEATRHA